MRRIISYIGISLLALLMSGRGSLIAAAHCPHAGMSQPEAIAEDHSCCLAKLVQAGEHSHHEAAHGAKTVPVAAHHLHGSNAAVALGQPHSTCAHCISQNELPNTPASARELILQKRAAGKAIGHAAVSFTPPVAVYIKQFAPTQHAPPGHASRKQILLNVFLI
jgi:hypothetical protein